MQRFFSAFPAGRAGIGLLLLRLAAGAAIFMHVRTWLTSAAWTVVAAAALAVVIALFLLAGFMTPIAGSVAAAMSVVADPYLFVITAAIVLLGPGAFSIDARLFGRREIVL